MDQLSIYLVLAIVIEVCCSCNADRKRLVFGMQNPGRSKSFLAGEMKKKHGTDFLHTAQ